VLGENLFEVPANQIKDIPILSTSLGGQKIFG
jgi:hypothetical protein